MLARQLQFLRRPFAAGYAEYDKGAVLAASPSIQPAQSGSFAFRLRVENSMTEQVALDKAWAEPTGTTSTFTSAVATREERSGNW